MRYGHDMPRMSQHNKFLRGKHKNREYEYLHAHYPPTVNQEASSFYGTKPKPTSNF